MLRDVVAPVGVEVESCCEGGVKVGKYSLV
jgi:hypothetical protein